MCAEGKQVHFFRLRVRTIFDEIFKQISADEFKNIYGKHFKQNWSRAGPLYNVWIKTVQENVMNDLDDFIQEAKCNEKLDKLADTISKCEADKKILAWRPTGVPEEDFRAHRIQEKLNKYKELTEFVNHKQLEVMELKNEVLSGRAKVQEIDMEVQLLMYNLKSDHDRHIHVQLKQSDNFKKLS